MRARHKTPQTFSLWMVDVMCASLGTVILLWVVNADEAKKSGDKLLTKDEQVLNLEQALAQLGKERDELTEKLNLSRKSVANLNALIATLEGDKANLQGQVRTEAASAAERKEQIERLTADLVKLTENRDSLAKTVAALNALKANLEGELKDKTDRTQASEKKIDDLLGQLARLSTSKEGVEKLLAVRIREVEELEKRLTLLGKANTTLDANLQTTQADSARKQKRIDELIAQADDLARKLLAAEKAVKELETATALLPKLREDLKDSRLKLDEEELKTKVLQADLVKRAQEAAKTAQEVETLLLARKALEQKMAGISGDLIKALAYKARAEDSEKKYEDLQRLFGEKSRDLDESLTLLKAIQGDKEQLNRLLEQRFAGIELTGKRVVFLVDTSGSMELLDERTPALSKWQNVRATLARLMRSMNNLEKFQVVTFSEEVGYPLGRAGQWIDFNPNTSPGEVEQALARVKPSGGTNLHKGFEAAFRLRRSGLDTVYLFSDGLPSDGEGLTPEQDRTIQDPTVRSTLLARDLRTKMKDQWNRPIVGEQPVRINSVGFFYESPDVGAFLWALSRENNGNFVGMSNP